VAIPFAIKMGIVGAVMGAIAGLSIALEESQETS
jgi:hypothetical protein